MSCAVLLFAAITAADADETTQPKKTPHVVPLQVHVVLTTRLGDKKLSSVPYAFTCLTADEPSASARTHVRLGTELPIPVTKAGDGSSGPTTSFQYRAIGTKIECQGGLLADGRFSLDLQFEQGSLEGTSKVGDVEAPIFKTRVADLHTIFRDGQTIQALTGADPTTGEVSTLDVTVTTLK
jgi:hypothetical protein